MLFCFAAFITDILFPFLQFLVQIVVCAVEIVFGLLQAFVAELIVLILAGSIYAVLVVKR